jgi:hypothetical protein
VVEGGRSVAVTCNKKDFHHRDHRITEKTRMAI